ncbi:MAG: helix-turn-helix domain-containing protein [Halobacteriota archaeon]
MSRDDIAPSYDGGEITRCPYALFARVHLSHSELPLTPTLEGAPHTKVRPRYLSPASDTLFFAANGDDFEAFESALATDPTIVSPVLVEDAGQHRVYRVALSESARHRLAQLSVADAYVHSTTGSDGVWNVRMELPGRESLVRLTSQCRRAGISVTIRRLNAADGPAHHNQFGLTAEQERILRIAYETGYFEVPRRASQVGLAESLGISTSAISQRLRRATSELVANTIAFDTE